MKSIFISGAARGIGLAIATKFYQQGYRVGMFDLDDSVTAAAHQLGEHAYAGFLDVSDPASWTKALTEFIGFAGHLDVLCNNAGVLLQGGFEDNSASAYQRLCSINIGGTMNGCLAAFPYLKETSGTVINLSSAAAIYGQPGLAGYSASKFAVRGLTEALNIEWAKYDIYVADIMPLFVNTEMTAGLAVASFEKLKHKQLSTTDVTERVWQAVSDRQLSKVHFSVGNLTKVVTIGAKFGNQQINRWVNRKLGT